jgi:diacylglycerol kinase family enzyme
LRPLLLAVDADPPSPGDFDAARVTRSALAAYARGALGAGCLRIGILGTDADAALVAAEAHRLGTEVEIAIGTDGDLARMFGLGLGSPVTDRLLNGTRYPIDLGIVEGGWGMGAFINDIGFGVASARPGPLRWAVAGRSRVVVTGRRRVEEGRATGVLVTNGQFWHGLAVSPKASLADERLEYQVITVPRRRAAATLAAMRLGLHGSFHGLRRGRADVIEIEVPPGWPVAADRRRIGRGSATARVVPGVVSLLI